MNENNGYAAYILWMGLHLHFTSKSYNWVQYHGKVKISKEQFLNKKEKYTFYALSRKYSYEELKEFFVANLFNKPKMWSNELNTAEADEVYKDWKKRTQSLTYRFEQDIIKLFAMVETPQEIVRVKGGQEPLLLKQVYYGNIIPETLIILNHYLKFFDMWKTKIGDDIVFPEYIMKCEKYEPFLLYDGVKLKKVLVDKIKEYSKNEHI
jgi:hypothetical protein